MDPLRAEVSPRFVGRECTPCGIPWEGENVHPVVYPGWCITVVYPGWCITVVYPRVRARYTLLYPRVRARYTLLYSGWCICRVPTLVYMPGTYLGTWWVYASLYMLGMYIPGIHHPCTPLGIPTIPPTCAALTLPLTGNDAQPR